MTSSHDTLTTPVLPPVEIARRSGPTGQLIATRDGLDGLVLRWALAIVIFPHGAQKLLGWFGGRGWDASLQMFTEGLGLPAFVAALVILIEFFGPILLVCGLASRVAATGIGAVMLGAVLTRHVQHGFFMNWSGEKAGEGFELHILALGICLALLIAGSGRASLDRAITRRLAAKETFS